MQMLNLKPQFCCIAATDFCMLKCRMCNKWKEPHPPKDQIPTLDDWKRFIKNFKGLVDEDFELNFGGGEALTMPGILELVRYANDVGFSTTIATNAYLINEEMAKQINNSGLRHISISLDSLIPDKHDKFRGIKGVHKRVMAAIDNLHKYCPNLRKGICTIIMNDNIEELEALADWVINNEKLHWIYYMSVVQPNYSGPLDAQWQEEYKYLWPDDHKQITQVIDNLINKKKNGAEKISNRVEHLLAYKAYFSSPKQFVNKAKCMIGGKALSINTYGDIQLCFFMDFIGNIKRNNIVELWHSDAAEKVRRKVDNCKNNCHLLLNCCYIEDDGAVC